MAPTAVKSGNLEAPQQQTTEKATSVKALIEESGFTAIPSSYSFSTIENQSSDASEHDSLPIIDYSKLTSDDPQLRSAAIRDLEIACREWGFFLLENHGVTEGVMKALLDGCQEFFDMSLEEKQKYGGRDVWQPIRFGTGVDVKIEKFFLWRDFLKMFVHPEFHCPAKPDGFSEAAKEYSSRTHALLVELLKGISQTLGLEPDYIQKAMNVDSSFALLAANLYPACPQPDLAMGIPAHTDHGLLTFLIQNGVGGLQIQHKGEWYNANPPPNCIVVNTGDQLEILSNGRYKSVMHRAAVNNKVTRISIANPNGPALDLPVSPAKELVERDGGSPVFKTMTYKEYIEFQQGSPTPGLSCTDLIRYDQNA